MNQSNAENMESRCPLSFCQSSEHTCIEHCTHPRKYEYVAPIHSQISELCKEYVYNQPDRYEWTFYLGCIKTVYFSEDNLNDEQLLIFLYLLGIRGPFTYWTRDDKIGDILEKYRIFMCDWFIERENTFPDTVTPDPVPDTVHPDPMPVTVTPVPDTTDHYDEMLDEMLLENDPPVYMSREQLLYHSTRRALAEASVDLSLVEDSALEGRALEGRALEGRALEGRALEGRALEGRALEGRALEGRALEGRALDDDDIPSLISEEEYQRREHLREQIYTRSMPSYMPPYMPSYPRNNETTKYSIHIHKADTTDYIHDGNGYVECPICYEAECFVTLSCQHSFCECILTHVLNKPLNTCCTCPCCRQTITQMTVHSPKFYKIIRATTVKHSNMVFV